MAGDFRMPAEIVFIWRSAEKYWRTIIWNPCLCAAILMCQWDVFLGIIWVLFIIHCVWCQMPWPNDLATCLSQICLSWCPWVNLLHLSRCLCVFPMFFVVHISFSLIHTLFVLWQTYLVSLGTAVMTLRHSYSCFFFKRWLICFRIKDESPLVWPRILWWDSRKGKGVFSFENKLLGLLGCWESLWWFFFWIFFQPIWNGEESSSDFFTGV